MSNSKIIETYDAGGAISKFRIVKHGADDENVLRRPIAPNRCLGSVTCWT